MNDEHRENIRKANKRRSSHLCRMCYNIITIRDGKEIGGVPTIKYRCCDCCGWTQATTKKPSRFKF